MTLSVKIFCLCLQVAVNPGWELNFKQVVILSVISASDSWQGTCPTVDGRQQDGLNNIFTGLFFFLTLQIFDLCVIYPDFVVMDFLYVRKCVSAFICVSYAMSLALCHSVYLFCASLVCVFSFYLVLFYYYFVRWLFVFNESNKERL